MSALRVILTMCRSTMLDIPTIGSFPPQGPRRSRACSLIAIGLIPHGCPRPDTRSIIPSPAIERRKAAARIGESISLCFPSGGNLWKSKSLPLDRCRLACRVRRGGFGIHCNDLDWVSSVPDRLCELRESRRRRACIEGLAKGPACEGSAQTENTSAG